MREWLTGKPGAGRISALWKPAGAAVDAYRICLFIGDLVMYAVIQSGGKQHRVAEGDTLRVEKLAAEEGATLELDRVLLVADGDDVKIGTPYLEGGKVTATVKAHGRGTKVKIVKFKRRKQYLKRQGHRQWYTELQITGISAG